MKGKVMKRNITVGKDFSSYIKEPLISDDVQAYNIVWELKDVSGGASFLINAKRCDGETITDSGTIDENMKAEYVLKSNMYAVPGPLEIRLSIVENESVVTRKLLHFDVIEGNGTANIEGEDKAPVLANIMSTALSALDKAESLPDKLSGFENDCGFISEISPDVIPDDYITPEKVSFYNELYSMGKEKLITEKTFGREIIVRDKIKNTKPVRIEINGDTVQYNCIINYRNMIYSDYRTGLKVMNNVYGEYIVSGTMEAGREVSLNIGEIPLYEGCTYKETLIIPEGVDMKVYAQGFYEGYQREDSSISVLKFVQGDTEATYDNLVIRYEIYEEERSGKNNYPIYSTLISKVIISPKNLISYDDLQDTKYLTIERKDGGVVLTGRYYADVSEDFISRLEKGKTYTFSAKRYYREGSSQSNCPRIRITYDDGTHTQWANNYPTATVEDKEIVNATFYVSGANDVKCEIRELMFEEGVESTEYEEYYPEIVCDAGYQLLYGNRGMCDKIIIDDKVRLLKYIDESAFDLTSDISLQNAPMSLFADETIISEDSGLGAIREKTMKITVTGDLVGSNSIKYMANKN